MNKSIFVIDTPNSCEDCELCRDGYLCLRLGEVDESVENGTKDLGCPLRPLPQARDEHCRYDNWEMESIINAEHRGFNKCLHEITGETE